MKITVFVDGPTDDTGLKVENSPHDAASVQITIGGSMTTVKAAELVSAVKRAEIDRNPIDF